MSVGMKLIWSYVQNAGRYVGVMLDLRKMNIYKMFICESVSDSVHQIMNIYNMELLKNEFVLYSDI